MIKKRKKILIMFSFVALFILLAGGFSRTYAKEVNEPQQIVLSENNGDKVNIETNIVVVDTSDRSSELGFNDQYMLNLMGLMFLIGFPAVAIGLFWNVD